MFTQAAPALYNAMRPGSSPQQLIQSIANCNAPLTHRAAVNLAVSPRRSRDGTYGGGTWNPSQYPGLFPNAENYSSVDVGGMTATWNSGNQYDSQFFFPTNQFFTQNQFFGGPVLNVQNHAQIDYITNRVFEGDTVNVENVTTEDINGDPVVGPAGPPGRPGAEGRPGAPGGGGFAGPIPKGQFRDLEYLFGRNPRVRFQNEPVARPHKYIADAWVRPLGEFPVPLGAIAGGTVTITPAADSVSIPTGVTFNPETCEVSFTGFTTITFATPQAVTAELSSVSATAATILAIDAMVAATTRASDEPVGPGVLVKAEFKETPKITVCRDPQLDGVFQGRAALLHR